MGVSALAAFAAVTTPVDAQIYRSVGPDGRVQYSDKPPTGESGKTMASKGISATAVDELKGEWVVASATVNGEPVVDEKIVGAQWMFSGTDWTVTTRKGEKGRFTFQLLPESGPKEFKYAPVAPSTERAGEMIYERTGERLRVAYMEIPDQRPAGFEPRRKQVIINLTPKAAAQGPGYASAGAGRDACSILRNAGARTLLRAEPFVATPAASAGTDAACRLEGAAGMRVSVQLIPVANRATLDSERAKQVKQAQTAAAPRTVQDEPALGEGAFVVLRGNSTLLVALKGDTMMMLAVDVAASNHAAVMQFAQQVRSAL
ncbi:MAG: TIGR03067 domain-containing protein [Betaproteobacteria bacterium]